MKIMNKDKSKKQIKNIKIIDPVCNIIKDKYYACLQGPSYVTKRRYVFQSYSNNSAQLSFTTPNPRTFLDRYWRFGLPITVQIDGDSNDPNRNIINSGQDAFRQYVIASIMEVLDIKLNGQSSNLNVADVIKPLTLYHNNKGKNLGERELSITPSYPDMSQTYAELDGSTLNPLNSMYDSNYGASQPRGAFPYDSFSNTTTQAVVTATFVEDLFLSPLMFGSNKQDEGFINLQDVEINITWKSDLSLVWCHSSASSSTINSITVTLGQPFLELTYKTPLPSISIPRKIDYRYNEIKRYVTPLGNLNPGQSTTAISNNFQVGAIPRFLYIFARKRAPTYTDTDSYAQINQLQIDFDNQNALLASASPYQLYQISRKNGVNLNWTQWSCNDSYSYLGNQTDILNGVGSVFCCEFGTDIGLKVGECGGLRDTYNLQIQMEITNKHPTDTINFDLFVISVIPGIWRIEDRTAQRIVGVLNRLEVFKAREIEGIDYEDLQDQLMSGGSKFSKALKKIGKYAKKYGVPIAKIAGKTLKGVAPEFSGIVDLGLDALEKASGGYNEELLGSALVGGKKRGRPKKKVGRPKKRGGKLMTKKELMDRYMELM